MKLYFSSICCVKRSSTCSIIGLRGQVSAMIGMLRQVYESIQFPSVSTMISKRPIWSVPVPACAITTPFSSTACSRNVWECPPIIRSTPQAGSSCLARCLSSSKPICVRITVKSISILLCALQIFPISAAAAAVSTNAPTNDSDFV